MSPANLLPEKKAIVVYTHIVGTAVIRALGKMGVPVVALHYSPDEVGYVSRYVTEHVKVPDLRPNPSAFLESLMGLSERFAGSLLIPTDDYTLSALSMNKRLLETEYVVAAGDWDVVSQCVSKEHTYAHAHAAGVPCPSSFLVRSPEDLEQHKHEVGFPCLMKPCEGHRFHEIFGVKMFKIANEDELYQQFKKVSARGLAVLLQEIIPGSDAEGVNYNSYFVDGMPVAEFTARKMRLEPPFFGSPRVIVSESVPEIVEPGRRLLRELKYNGFSCMEFKRDTRDGIYKLMEINCRHNRSGSLAVRCGMNFPWIMYQHLVKGEIVPRTGFREKVAWIEGTSDVIRFFVSRSEERYPLREYVRPYCLEKIFAFLSLRDPLPFLKRTEFLARKALRRLAIRLGFRPEKRVLSRSQTVK
jgi:predicted ATP-grasp superfamily ATP-dependent carboligase